MSSNSNSSSIMSDIHTSSDAPTDPMLRVTPLGERNIPEPMTFPTKMATAYGKVMCRLSRRGALASSCEFPVRIGGALLRMAGMTSSLTSSLTLSLASSLTLSYTGRDVAERLSNGSVSDILSFVS